MQPEKVTRLAPLPPVLRKEVHHLTSIGKQALTMSRLKACLPVLTGAGKGNPMDLMGRLKGNLLVLKGRLTGTLRVTSKAAGVRMQSWKRHGVFGKSFRISCQCSAIGGRSYISGEHIEMCYLTTYTFE